MTRDEYIKNMTEADDWSPGWDAIDEAFDRIYKDQTPSHYGTDVDKRAIFGGNQYLDGYSIYQANDYLHIVSYGLTTLYSDENSFGNEWSNWGYEMTFKLKDDKVENCLWILDTFANLAYYTNTSERFFEPNQYISGKGTSLDQKMESKITALITTYDTEVSSIDTPHGKVDFIQFVGITEGELDAIRSSRITVEKLVELMKKDNPNLVTDMGRKISYID